MSCQYRSQCIRTRPSQSCRAERFSSWNLHFLARGDRSAPRKSSRHWGNSTPIAGSVAFRQVKTHLPGIVAKRTDRTCTRQHSPRQERPESPQAPTTQPPTRLATDRRLRQGRERRASARSRPAQALGKARLFDSVVSRAPWPVSRATYLVSVGSATGTGRQMLKIDGDGGGRQTTGSQPEGKGQRDGVSYSIFSPRCGPLKAFAAAPPSCACSLEKEVFCPTHMHRRPPGSAPRSHPTWNPQHGYYENAAGERMPSLRIGVSYIPDILPVPTPHRHRPRTPRGFRRPSS